MAATDVLHRIDESIPLQAVRFNLAQLLDHVGAKGLEEDPQFQGGGGLYEWFAAMDEAQRDVVERWLHLGDQFQAFEVLIAMECVVRDRVRPQFPDQVTGAYVVQRFGQPRESVVDLVVFECSQHYRPPGYRGFHLMAAITEDLPCACLCAAQLFAAKAGTLEAIFTAARERSARTRVPGPAPGAPWPLIGWQSAARGS